MLAGMLTELMTTCIVSEGRRRVKETMPFFRMGRPRSLQRGCVLFVLRAYSLLLFGNLNDRRLAGVPNMSFEFCTWDDCTFLRVGRARIFKGICQLEHVIATVRRREEIGTFLT